MAVALSLSKETLTAAFEPRARIDHIVARAEQQGSLAIALVGLNSIRHTLDSLADWPAMAEPDLQLMLRHDANGSRGSGHRQRQMRGRKNSGGQKRRKPRPKGTWSGLASRDSVFADELKFMVG